ncbi:hypothetical protein MKX01_003902 [Papaver californicum]|nr:hypothetical protein MKX01_003902 [Papaver californicum]
MSCIEGFRRRFTLSDQMSIIDTSLNLRDLLRVRDDHHQDSSSSINCGGRNSLAGLTLGAVLGCEDMNVINNNGRSDESNHNQFQLQQPPIRTPSRTLLDIIKDEESGTSYRGLHLEEDNSSSNSNSKQKSWKSFKDRLLLRKAGAAAAGVISSLSNGNPIVVSDDDCGGVVGENSSPGIRRRSSFSVVSPTTTSIVSPAAVVSDDHAQNDLNEQGGNTVSSTLASSSSEPVVIMRLAAALAAEREEQRQQLVSSSSSSTDAQLQENTTTATVLQVAEEDDDQQGRAINQTQTQIQNQTQSLIQNQNQTQTPIPNQNQTQTPIQNQNQIENQRGVIASANNDNQPLRVSLMALLEETVDYNRQDLMDIEEEEGDDQDQLVVVDKILSDKEKGGSGSGMSIEEYKCCVCMIRPKGAAFIPCGHTFCRLCSRKLWVNRGNCPLCNSFILEILDIF